ncbi:MAG: DUF58 domain-containing protein, partial [Candidatus Promineifilaceae bacterium]
MASSRRTGVLILALLALIGGLTTGRDLFYSITYMLGLLLLVSFAWSWSNINWLHLSRVTRTRRTQVGRPLEERFTVRNTSPLPKLWLEVRDASNLPAHHASKVVNNLGARGGFTWRVNTLCQSRGRYRLGPLQLFSSDPFGLFPVRRELSATTNVVVFPMTVEVHQFALPLGVLSGGDALRRRTHYVTTNASGVRDYAPGDSFSRIHWRSTARRDRLIAKEFELDPLADIWVIADMAVFAHISRQRPPAEPATFRDDLPAWMRIREPEYQLPDATEEYTVTIAASLAQYFLRRNRAVGLLAYGASREILQPDRGERQLNRILETLAVVRADGQIAIEDVLNAEANLFARGTTAIVVTPTTRESWAAAARQLSRRGLRMVSVLLDPESFGGQRSSAGLAYMLQAGNMLAHVVRCGEDLTAALSAGKVRSRYQTA